MELLGLITCDERPDQPLAYGKKNGKYFFIIHDTRTEETKNTIIDIPFDEICPLSNMHEGITYIGVRIGTKWSLWRYSLWNYNDHRTIPYCVHLFRGYYLEELTSVYSNSFEECLKKYSLAEYNRFWKYYRT